MAATVISDVIVPEVYGPYLQQLTVTLINFYLAGLVTADPSFDVLASRGGRVLNMPYWDDLTGNDEVLSDAGSLTVGAITAGQDVAALLMRGRAFGANDLAKALSGDDPMAAIAALVANYKLRMLQATLISTLAGVIADNVANDSGDMVNDIASETIAGQGADTRISVDAVVDALTGTMGDAYDKLTGLAMHSAVFLQLQKQNAIEYEVPAGADIKIPYYLGKRVLVSDSMPVRAGTTDGFVYTTYLFGPGAFAFGEGGAPVPVETDRDSLAGEDILVNRWHQIIHPRGIAFQDSSVAGSSPTNAELEAEANWDRVWERKNIRIAALDTN